MTAERPGRGRPTDDQKRDAIVAAGWRLFLADGVDAVTVESIAQSAGVSKVTLYKHFPNKTDILRAGVQASMEAIEAAQALSATPTDLPLREQLLAFGEGILHFLVSEDAVSFYARLAGELSKDPDLAADFYAHGPGRTKTNLTAVLTHANATGALQVADPGEAAEQLFGMWQGFSNFQLALGTPDRPTQAQIPRRVAAAVDTFLAANGYSPSDRPRR